MTNLKLKSDISDFATVFHASDADTKLSSIEHIVAWIVKAEGRTPTEDEVRKALNHHSLVTLSGEIHGVADLLAVASIDAPALANRVISILDSGTHWDGTIELLFEKVEPSSAQDIEDSFNTTEEGTDMTEEAKATTITIKDEGMVAALDAVMKGAIEGATSIRDMINQLNSSSTDIASLTEQLERVKKAASKASFSSAPSAPEVTDLGELTYQVEMVEAADIFTSKTSDGKIRKSPALKFQIPSIVWKQADGTVVNHPEKPEVDDDYIFQPTMLLKFLVGMVKNSNTWLYGHTGTGKTTFVEQISARLGFPVTRVNLDRDLERADFVGKTDLVNKDGATVTEFVEGLLPRAMKRPGYLIMDEITSGKPDILFVIQRVLEGNGLMLTEEGGKIVKPNGLFRLVATDNTRGQGDEYGMYPGTRVMNQATLDRFPVFIEVDYLSKDNELKLVKAKSPAISDAIASQLVLFSNEIRKAFKNAELMAPISPRGLCSIAENVVTLLDFGMKDEAAAVKMSLEMGMFDKTTSDTVLKVREIADRCFKAAA